MRSPRLLVVAGETSGDMHGARLFSELRRRRPEIEGFGLGGSELEAAGLDLLARSSEIAVVGLLEALTVLPRAHRIFHRILSEVERRPPDAAVLIDSPDFNLRLARRLAERDVPVVYYVSPQVWAWRSGRVETIRRSVDRMLVLFAFERDWYAERGVEAKHVGHPLLDEVPRLPQAWEAEAEAPETYRLALLPGSRRSEIEAHLPLMLAAAEELGRRFPVELRLIQAPDLPAALLDAAIEGCGLPIRLVRSERWREIADSHLALCASGTATLEVGLLRTPLVVVYRMNRWSHWLGRMVIRVPHISMVNLVLGGEVVPELVQRRATPESLAEAAGRLLTDAAARGEMQEALRGLREALGEPGGSARAAREVLDLLEDAA
ncbi:MAG: lipid-A-disaccharide synthase [Thermoanaerobaculia bacterium]|nr:lipid-A-disaccharide synthase [Thermoanaerobaculia bacterium]